LDFLFNCLLIHVLIFSTTFSSLFRDIDSVYCLLFLFFFFLLLLTYNFFLSFSVSPSDIAYHLMYLVINSLDDRYSGIVYSLNDGHTSQRVIEFMGSLHQKKKNGMGSVEDLCVCFIKKGGVQFNQTSIPCTPSDFDSVAYPVCFVADIEHFFYIPIITDCIFFCIWDTGFNEFVA
jgi:hypothetical protein